MTRWNKNNCHQEALKYLYKRDFKKNSYGAYQAMYRNKWQDEICSHMIIDECIVEASKFKNRNEFKNNNNPMWQFAKKT